MLRWDCSQLPELAVIGWPLDHTFSPPMQTAALRQTGFNWGYEAIPVPPEKVPEFFARASQTMKGFNVTMPHKFVAYQLCPVLDGLSAVCGSVNTVVFERKGPKSIPTGHNTDGPGLLTALKQRAGYEPAGSTVLVLGAGGAAAGCAAALARAGAASITIVNRTPERARELARNMEQMFDEVIWQWTGPNNYQAFREALSKTELVINCMPEEGAEQFAALVCGCPGNVKVLCDLSYNADPGALFLLAKQAGYRVVSGIEVLLWQGVYAFELFTAHKAPVEAMTQALVEVAGSWWLTC
ncbi:MAG: shikimate dehydrogenase [Bacillota bacterium]